MSLTVGFIGLGDIGGPMARNLCERFETIVYDLDAEAVKKLVEAGAKPAQSSLEVAASCDISCVCVLDDAATRAVVAGEEGLLAGARPGSLIVIHSTIHPDTVRELAERAAKQDVALVDAQMTGGAAAVKARQLRYMVGGDADDLDRCTPVLEASAGQITRCGPVGSGAVAKLCNNLVQFTCWQAFEEGLRLARRAGLEKDTILEVLGWIMNDNARAFFAGRDARAADPANEFLDTRFDAVMKLAEKDMTLALSLARSVGVSMPTAGLCTQQLARLFGVPDPKRR
jgi:3-hydroxyisobutyrate dehydrogenase-like beta-hydroxyacid dehydrogenase